MILADMNIFCLNMERNFQPWEAYLRTAFRIDNRMVNNQMCGCDLLQCYGCINYKIVGGNLAAGRLKSLIESSGRDNRPTRTDHPGPVGWRGPRNGCKKILNTCDFDSIEKLIVFGRSHVLISNSLLWKFFGALSSFGKRNLPVLTDEEVAHNRIAGAAAAMDMDTSLSSSSRFALAKLRRDAAGGTKDEGELQYYRGWIDSVPQPSRKRNDESLVTSKSAGHINDGNAVSGHLMIRFGIAGTSLESAPMQELLFLVLGNAVYPFESGPRYNAGEDDSVLEPCWRRRQAKLSYFYVRQAGDVPAVPAANHGPVRMITRIMAARQKRKDEHRIRTQLQKLEKGCVCVAE